MDVTRDGDFTDAESAPQPQPCPAGSSRHTAHHRTAADNIAQCIKQGAWKKARYENKKLLEKEKEKEKDFIFNGNESLYSDDSSCRLESCFVLRDTNFNFSFSKSFL